MAILMGRWDCSACDTKGVMGDAYECSNCGAGRPDDVEFYLPDNAEVVTDAAGIAAAEAGADIKCDYCGQFYAAVDGECRNCGGDGAERHEDAGKEVATPKMKPLYDSSSSSRVDYVNFYNTGFHKRPDVKKEEPKPRPAPSKHKGSWPPASPVARMNTNWKPIVASAVGVGLLVALFFAIFSTSEVPATVSHHSWERVQKVEEFTRGIRKDGWDHPSDAYDITTSREIHHYNKVVDHYDTVPVYSTRQVQTGTEPVYSTETYTENLGNGRFATRTRRVQTGTRPVYRSERYQSGTEQKPVYRDEPVYDTYYHYKVDRWVAGKPRVRSGLGLNPEWPSTEVRDADQRMGGRSATYTVHFLESHPDEGEEARTWSKTYDESAWRAWEDNERVVLVVNSLGIREIKRVQVEMESSH